MAQETYIPTLSIIPFTTCFFHRPGIEIISTSDVVVYGENPVTGNTDIFLALPVDTLGDTYYVASYKANHSQHRAQVGIVSVYNDTTVNVSVPRLGRGLQVKYQDIFYGEGETIELVMNAYDTVQLDSDLDLTGLKVTASQPVAIVSGDTLRVESEDGEVWYDHVVEQMIPTHSWGKSFVSMPFSGASAPTADIFHVIGKLPSPHVAHCRVFFSNNKVTALGRASHGNTKKTNI